ncbi:MAG: hypothetical protein C0476_09435, partial [Sphingomonas sp.]|nr:hypothetical protein [Sphingomonas sp.]
MRSLLAPPPRSHRGWRAVWPLCAGGGVRPPVAGLAVAAGAFALDQLVKWFVTGPMALNSLADPAVDLLPIFRMRFVANDGVSLGLLRAGSDEARWALVAMTAAIAAGVLAWLWREPRRWDQAALGLVLGGALGNIVDRARL